MSSIGRDELDGGRQAGVETLTYTASLLAFSSRFVERAPTPFSSSTLIWVKVSNKKHLAIETYIL